MKFLLDTNTCSEYLRGRAPVTVRVLAAHAEIAVSAVTAAELFVWGYRAKSSARWRQPIGQFLGDVPVLDTNLAVADCFGRLHADQLDRGRPTSGLDLLIAATALVHNLTLVTHNTRDFADVPGLQLEDWQAA
jgi:tRNA(fMet)-specific endonuclease VapC